MRRSSAFKFKKEYKRIAATILDNHKRGEYIRNMIEAQLCEQVAASQPLKKGKEKE